MSLLVFGSRVKSYLKAAGYSQKMLAHFLGWEPTVLNHKLNGTGRTILTHPEVRGIIRHLARMEAITTQSEALELLATVNCPDFHADDWKTDPLNKLEKDFQTTGYEKALKSFSFSNQNNLPVELTNFIGRQREVEEVIQLILVNHLVTLTGPGGTGKSRLALQVAAALTDTYKDGVWLIELAPLCDSRLVVQTLGFVLGIKEDAGQSFLTKITNNLRSKQTLLVLDNCEHLLDESSKIIEILLKNCPDLRVIATSRESLCIGGEIIFPVPPLSLPDDTQQTTRLFPEFIDKLSHYEAVELFIDRALKIQTGFKLTSQNAQSVLQICYRLDGIPLAIELAVARLKGLNVEQILERLDDRFRLLTTGSRTASSRQQTLKGAIDWSYYLLQEEEQRLFRILATFPGGCNLSAAEKICSKLGLEEHLILDLLFQLVNKSLLIKEDNGGQIRYRMLETIRQYGQEKLKEVGELNICLETQLNYFLAFCENAAREFEGPEQIQWLDWVEIEHDNLRQLLNWALKQKDPELGLRLCIALSRFWHIRGYNNEAQQWLDQVLDSDLLIPQFLQVKILIWAATLRARQGAFNEGLIFCHQAIAICRESGNLLDLAWALNALGVIFCRQGNLDQGEVCFNEGLEVCKELDDKTGIAVMLDNLGGIALDKGDFVTAELNSKQALTIYSSLNNLRGQVQALSGIAKAALHQNEFARAAHLATQGLRLNEEVKDKRIKWFLTDILGAASEQQGDVKTAKTLYLEALIGRQNLQDRPAIAVSLENLGKLAILQGEVRRGGWFLGAAEKLLNEISDPKRLLIVQNIKTSVVSKTNIKITDSFSSAWHEGYSISFEDITLNNLEFLTA